MAFRVQKLPTTDAPLLVRLFVPTCAKTNLCHSSKFSYSLQHLTKKLNLHNGDPKIETRNTGIHWIILE